MKKGLFALVCLASFLAACGSKNKGPVTPPAPKIDSAAVGIDDTVRPGDDFFKFANGTWLKSTAIPDDRASWGVHAELGELTAKRTADLIQQAAKANAADGSDQRKVGDFFAAFMDEAAIETAGLKPIQPKLKALDKVNDAKSLSTALGASMRADVDILNATSLHTSNVFGLWVAQDLDEPTKYAPFVIQGGLGMPEREYYLSDDKRMTELQAKYKVLLAAVFKAAKITDPDGRATRVFELEKKIAATHGSLIDTQDVVKGNNHWARKDLDAKAPGLDWQAFLTAAKLDKEQTFVMWQPSAVTGISALVRSEPVGTWRDLLTAHTLLEFSAVLPKAFGDAAFEFYGKAMTGTPKQRDRWKRAVAATDNALGEVVGKLYVAQYFPPAEKTRAEEMVKNVVAAFGKRIENLNWMAAPTKKQALAKLAVLKVGVGYPDKWRDYSGLAIAKGDAVGNQDRAETFEYDRNVKKLGKPVDRGEWVMNAQLVNAVNLPAMNALNFPAAILQPPDFDRTKSDAANYGATGATIGHEICHSFDDSGAQFDATGKLADWWTKEDYGHFKSSSDKLALQYDAYMPFLDLHINGKQTSSENIADVAGLLAAYDAYKLASANSKDKDKLVNGLTGDQQFYLAFAQSWRSKAREEAMRQAVQTDGHAPAEYRADTVRNLDAWYLAFEVKPADKLYIIPTQRIRVY